MVVPARMPPTRLADVKDKVEENRTILKLAPKNLAISFR
jgi:hypothetical protein